MPLRLGRFTSHVHFRCSSKMLRVYASGYTGSLNLPTTAFPLTMKGNIAPDREVEIQKKCNWNNLYQWQWNDAKRKKLFVLHDGPPYANGDPHVGHALNKILKDITNRYKLLRGYRVHYIPGWDCHGMPIEQKALADARLDHRAMNAVDIRNRASAFAQKAARKQLAAFRRWGVMADWDNCCYYTSDKSFEVAELEAFYSMFTKGLVYQDYMPVHWSPSSGTALAEAEIEYNDVYRSTAVYVKYKLKQVSNGLSNLVPSNSDVFAVIWTTTPWTLPTNRAICFGSNIEYCLMKNRTDSSCYITSSAFAGRLSEIFGNQLDILQTFSGSALAGSTYTCPLWSNIDLPLLSATHVTTEKGTGLVHTAPAHGVVDFQVALQHGLSMHCFVDEDGRYTEGVNKILVGKAVLTDGNNIVLKEMADQIIHRETIVHSYPHDWRTKQPLITRASRQWFVNTAKLKHRVLDCLEKVKVFPASSNVGMLAQLERRTYWCISRQRVWGMPIPVFYESQTRKPLISRASVDHLKKLFAIHGSDCWWNMPITELLPTSVVQESGFDPLLKYERGNDVLDIWFDSGISWSPVLKDCDNVADVYLEGVDQFGGWFQSSLLTSVAVQDKAPYKALIVHNFALDEEGKKMSKSLGNVVDPDIVINGGKDKKSQPAYGADALRLWAAQSGTDPRVHIGPSLLNDTSERLFRVRKSLRYLMSNLADFDQSQHLLSYDQLNLVDQFAMHQLFEFVGQVTEAYEEYSYSRVVTLLEKFCSSTVSAFHAHVTKDRLYCSRSADNSRRSAQTVQFYLLDAVVRSMAPILPHLAEEVHQYKPLSSYNTNAFKLGWFIADKSWVNDELAAIFRTALEIREAFHAVIASGRPGDYDLTIVSSPELHSHLRPIRGQSASSAHSDLCEIFQSATVELLDDLHAAQSDSLSSSSCPDSNSERSTQTCRLHSKDGSAVDTVFTLTVRPAQGCHCPRCRRLISKAPDVLCERCSRVVS